MKHLIIDVETLGIDNKSVVLQFVAALYDGETGLTHIRGWKLDALSQKQYGRKIDIDTVKWWSQQNITAQESAFTPHPLDIEPEVALTEFEEWLNEYKFTKKDFIWQRGSMDYDWLASLFIDCGWLFDKVPIKFYRVRDIRTAVDVLGFSERLSGYPDNTEELKARVPEYKQHDARSDVMFEVEVMKEIGLF